MKFKVGDKVKYNKKHKDFNDLNGFNDLDKIHVIRKVVAFGRCSICNTNHCERICIDNHLDSCFSRFLKVENSSHLPDFL